jgi:hypothetical protein
MLFERLRLKGRGVPNLEFILRPGETDLDFNGAGQAIFFPNQV